MVGTTGFEPATSYSRTRRATKLRHVPTKGRGILPMAWVLGKRFFEAFDQPFFLLLACDR